MSAHEHPTEPLQEQLAQERAARRLAEQQLADLVARVDNAQRLATMGDYDWHVATDTNTWSDELYRIYGYEPGSIEPSYAVFLEHVHPDDRERVTEVHRHAYATGEPYEMIERIVRPDGEVRHLSSNGQVVCDASGTPLRFRGTCIDVTERVLAEQEREDAARRLGEAQQRRRQASEINDNVVQGLTAALYAGQLGDHVRAADYVQQTLAAACRMMTELMDVPGAGDPTLVRSRAADLGGGSGLDP